MKKVIAILAILLVIGGVIGGLFFFLNRDKGEQPLQPGPTDNVFTEVTPPPVSTPENTPQVDNRPSYLEMYTKYTELPGLEFNVPQKLLDEGVKIEELEGSLNGQTAIYKTENTFAIKKIGSFMMGIVPYEKDGVYDSMYVSSITGLKEMKITDDMSFDFNDISFNSTSFNTVRGDKQKKSVISVKMVEPEYTNDTYEGYVLLSVNSQNKGYMLFIATTESEYMKVDVQSMVNNFNLVSDSDIPSTPDTPPAPEKTPEPQNEPDNNTGTVAVKVNVNMGDKEFDTGSITLTNTVDGSKSSTADLSDIGTISTIFDIEKGIYDISGTVKLKDGTEVPVLFNEDTITIDADLTIDAEV